MLFGVKLVWAQGTVYYMGCTLVLPSEYDGVNCMVAAMHAFATITVPTCYYYLFSALFFVAGIGLLVQEQNLYRT